MKFAFPDEGAFKRFGKPLQTHCPQLCVAPFFHRMFLTSCACTATATLSSVARSAPPANVFLSRNDITTIYPLALLLAQTRVGDDRRIWITDGNPQGTAAIKIELGDPLCICATDMCTGAHVVLVDDLVRSCLLYLNAILAL